MVRKTGFVLSMLIVLCGMSCMVAADSQPLNDVLSLLKAKVGEEVIKSHITNKSMTFDLSTQDILELKKAGASDDLVSFMMGGTSSEFPFDLNEDYSVHKPVVHEHLAIYPVFRKTAATPSDYITLDEAQHAKVIIIKEKENASVPTVLIKNKGIRSIYIMAGEIIIGGKQDRMVSFDIIIPPYKEVEVEVRCVEHGRWHGETVVFKSGGAVGCKSVRSALQFKEQQDVWAEVDRTCGEVAVESGSGTYGAILSSENVEEQSAPFLKAMESGLAGENMVGMIMALNGEVVCVDIFAAPSFFDKVKEKLLKAYVLDALSTDPTVMRAPGRSKIIAFFDEVQNAQTEELRRYTDNCNVEYESDEIIGNESRDKKGNVQHLNFYKK
ncbi:hypothetical protein JXB22_07220 [candidate division WOR-3 bacterium]|nr:hypothetical protein [candidate division WOR-3 bacterium]